MIKFNQFNVTNTVTRAKARIFYSLDNRMDGRKCVTLYDRDYGRDLQKVFESQPVVYKNDTDSMTDYFDKGCVRIFEDSPFYAVARAAAEFKTAKDEAKWNKKRGIVSPVVPAVAPVCVAPLVTLAPVVQNANPRFEVVTPETEYQLSFEDRQARLDAVAIIARVMESSKVR